MTRTLILALAVPLTIARGELRSDGRLKIALHGLVLASRAPVPPEMRGTNPPCIAPIVFVTSPANAWFATTGR